MEGELPLDKHLRCVIDTYVTTESIAPITVLQWNVLAGGLADAKSFPKVAPEDLDLATRQARILKYLTHSKLDVIVLEEMDFPEYITAALPDYDWRFKAKNSSDKANPDGVLIGVRRTCGWSIVSQSHHHYFEISGSVGSRLYLDIELQHKAVSKHLHIIGTHLKAKKSNHATRLHESSQLVDRLSHIASIGHLCIVAGDFNAEPSESSIIKILNADMTKAVVSDDVHTTAKYHCEHDHAVRQIDYIFYSRGITLRSSWHRSTHALGDTLLPDSIMPSDHLPIVVAIDIDK